MQWEKTKENNRYTVMELDAGDYTISLTTLGGHRATIGHRHDDEEYLIFGGYGAIITDTAFIEAEPGTLFNVIAEEHHQVINYNKEPLRFIGIYKKGISIVHGKPEEPPSEVA